MPVEPSALIPLVARSFALTYDYRCPFARIVHDHVVTAMGAGAEWDVTFSPFSLGQAHVADGESPVWDRPDDDSGLLALQVSIAVRDRQPDAFVAAHHSLFGYRHGSGGDLRDRDMLAKVVAGAGVDTDAMWAEVDSGRPLRTIAEEHTASVETHQVWGVPTFVVGESAVFVRLLDLPADATDARASIERILDQIEWSSLNEFKHTSIPR